MASVKISGGSAAITTDTHLQVYSRTLGRSVLTKLPGGSNSKVVYKIHVPCSCGKVYIGETKRRLEKRMKEHWTACIKGEVEKSAIAEHACSQHHPIL